MLRCAVTGRAERSLACLHANLDSSASAAPLHASWRRYHGWRSFSWLGNAACGKRASATTGVRNGISTAQTRTHTLTHTQPHTATATATHTQPHTHNTTHTHTLHTLTLSLGSRSAFHGELRSHQARGHLLLPSIDTVLDVLDCVGRQEHAAALELPPRCLGIGVDVQVVTTCLLVYLLQYELVRVLAHDAATVKRGPTVSTHYGTRVATSLHSPESHGT